MLGNCALSEKTAVSMMVGSIRRGGVTAFRRSDFVSISHCGPGLRLSDLGLWVCGPGRTKSSFVGRGR